MPALEGAGGEGSRDLFGLGIHKQQQTNCPLSAITQETGRKFFSGLDYKGRASPFWETAPSSSRSPARNTKSLFLTPTGRDPVGEQEGRAGRAAELLRSQVHCQPEHRNSFPGKGRLHSLLGKLEIINHRISRIKKSRKLVVGFTGSSKYARKKNDKYI